MEPSKRVLTRLRDAAELQFQDSETTNRRQYSSAMPRDEAQPIRKRLASETKGFATDPISLAIARDVLRRVREGELPSPERQEKK